MTRLQTLQRRYDAQTPAEDAPSGQCHECHGVLYANEIAHSNGAGAFCYDCFAGLSLHQRLRLERLTAFPAPFPYQKHIKCDRTGETLFTGDADATWRWLAEYTQTEEYTK